MIPRLILIAVLICCSQLAGSTDIQLWKDSLKIVEDVQQQHALIKKICRYYNHPDRLNDDSLRHYATRGLAALEDGPLSRDQVVMLAYQATSYYYEDPGKYFEIFKQARDLLEKLGKPLNAAQYSYNIAARYQNLGVLDSALANILLANTMLPEPLDLTNVKQAQVKHKILSLTAGVYHKMGDFPTAIEYVQRDEALARERGDSIALQRVYTNYGAIYGEINDKKYLLADSAEQAAYRALAEKYIREGYQLAQALPADYNRGAEAINLAFVTLESGDTTNAYTYFQEAMTRARQHHYWGIVCNASNEIARILIARDQLNEAGALIASTDSVIAMTKSKTWSIANALVKGAYFAARNQHRRAVAELDRAELLALTVNDRVYLRRVYLARYEYFKKRDRSQEALTYHEKYISLRDSLTSQSDLAEISYLQKQNVLLKKQAELTAQNAEHLKTQLSYRRKLFLSVFLGLLALSAGIIVWLINKNRITRFEKKSINLEQRLLRSQMNPHFTYNTLGSIQNYLIQSGKTTQGAYYLAKFAKLMRQILSQSRSEFVTLQEEIETLENYLSLQQLRYEEKFKYDIHVDPTLDPGTLKIPPMLIQPIVENAIEHGRIHTKTDGRVDINFQQVDGLLKVNVTDNGVGIESSRTLKPAVEHKSVALEIVNERLRFLKKKYGQLIRMIASERESGGTRVVFDLPFLKG